MKNELLVAVISGLAELDEEQLQMLWRRLAPGQNTPEPSNLLGNVQILVVQQACPLRTGWQKADGCEGLTMRADDEMELLH